MNNQILVASVLALAVMAPAANAAPVQRPVQEISRVNEASGIDKCRGQFNFGTTECKINPASGDAGMPFTTDVPSTEIDRGTGGSGTPAWLPKTYKVMLIMKANPVLDRGSNGHPSQL